MADRPAQARKARQLKPVKRQLGCVVQGQIGGEADLGGRDRQHAALTLLRGAKTTHHMVDVVGGGNPLGQPASGGVDGPGAEKLRVVVETPDQGGVTMAQAARGHPAQVLQVRLKRRIPVVHHRRPTGQGSEAGDALLHLGGVQEAVHQIGDLVEGTAAAAHGRQMPQLAQGLQ